MFFHVRATTKGSEINMDNNHPIHIPQKILGVHNGMVWNDDEIFKALEAGGVKRIGQVDTEAIFAALAYGRCIQDADSDTPILGPDITTILSKIEGTMAIAWCDLSDKHTLHLARGSSSPLHWVNTKDGSFFFASTAEAVKKAVGVSGLEMAGEVENVAEGTYMRVEAGKVEQMKSFTPYARPHSNHWEAQAYTHTPTRINSAPGWATSRDFVWELDHLFDDRVSLLAEWKFKREYMIRLGSIRTWCREEKVELGSHDAYLMGATIEPGDWVYTWILLPDRNPERVMAQVWLMPQTFPEGQYYLKAGWGWGKTKEEMIVGRTIEEFEPIPPMPDDDDDDDAAEDPQNASNDVQPLESAAERTMRAWQTLHATSSEISPESSETPPDVVDESAPVTDADDEVTLPSVADSQTAGILKRWLNDRFPPAVPALTTGDDAA